MRLQRLTLLPLLASYCFGSSCVRRRGTAQTLGEPSMFNMSFVDLKPAERDLLR